MSFTGQGEFVSLGYPWVLPEYEGELQERLYDAVFGFAASAEYGGRSFAQRFREPWTTQISFFRRHGFAEERRDPLYGLDLRFARIPQCPARYRVEVQQGFHWQEFHALAAPRTATEQLKMIEQYVASVEFDFSVRAEAQLRSAAYLGVTVRPDTGFSELVAVAVDPAAPDVVAPCLAAAIREVRLRHANFLGASRTLADAAPETLLRMGFSKISEELLLRKSLH